MDISVVIPVYGCREALKTLHQRLTSALKKITENYEIVFVNDDCPQNSWQVIEEICGTDSKTVGIELSRNFGQMKAILAGLDYSSGDWVVVMDCDLQDSPEEIINLYNKALEGYDVVFAKRMRRKDGKIKTWMSNMFYKVYSYASGVEYDPALCNFSISNRKVIEYYCSMRELHRAFVMYIKWMGFKQAYIEVEHNKRYEGKSGYNFKKRFKMAIDILTSQSDKLIRLMTGVGICISVISFIFAIINIVRYFTMDIVSGYSSTIIALFLIGGLIITSVGIVGIYVGSIFMEVKKRPLYLIRSILNGKDKA